MSVPCQADGAEARRMHGREGMMTNPLLQRLSAEIAALLESVPVRNIDFRVDTVHIHGGLYAQLARYVRLGVVSIDVRRLSPLRYAEYDPWTNTILLSHSTIPDQRARTSIVHEGTHAASDMLRIRRQQGLQQHEGEAIAYVAESLYHLSCGFTAPVAPDAIRRLALPVAQRLLDERRAHPGTVPVVLTRELRMLSNAVASHPAYRGIRGHSETEVSTGIP